MGESVRFNPVQYVDVTTPVLAGLVVEWDTMRTESYAASNQAVVKAGTGANLAEVCIAWARRRGLVDDRPSAAVEDARQFLVERPLSASERMRMAVKIQDTVQGAVDLAVWVAKRGQL